MKTLAKRKIQMTRVASFSSSSSSSDDDDAGTPPPPPSQAAKKQLSTASAAAAPKPPPPAPSASEEEVSDSESESGSETDSDAPAPHPSKKKKPPTDPVTTRPQPSTTPSTKPAATPISKPVSSDEDSGSETDEPEKPVNIPPPKPAGAPEPEKPNKSARKKQKASPAVDNKDPHAKDEPNGPSSKKFFERVWNLSDELALVRGMIEFQSLHGHEPTSLADAIALLEIIGKKLKGEFTPSQIISKFRSIKRKYTTNLAKEQENDGRLYLRPDQKEVFNLSKKLWGNTVPIDNGERKQAKESDKKVQEGYISKPVTGATPSPRKRKNVANEEAIPASVAASDKQQEGPEAMALSPAMKMIVEEIEKEGASLEKLNLLKSSLMLLKPEVLATFAGKWKDLQMEELKLWSMRTQLITDIVKTAMDGFANSHR